jgi:hypothetical protein
VFVFYVTEFSISIKLWLRRTLVLHQVYSAFLISLQHPDFIGGAFRNSIQLLRQW